MASKLHCNKCEHWGYPKLIRKANNIVGRCEECGVFIKNVPHIDTIHNPHGIIDDTQIEDLPLGLEQLDMRVSALEDLVQEALEQIKEIADKIDNQESILDLLLK